jgi:hypothetical protein
MGEASHDMIGRWSYAECRAGLRAALASVGFGLATPGTSRAAAVK